MSKKPKLDLRPRSKDDVASGHGASAQTVAKVMTSMHEFMVEERPSGVCHTMDTFTLTCPDGASYRVKWEHGGLHIIAEQIDDKFARAIVVQPHTMNSITIKAVR